MAAKLQMTPGALSPSASGLWSIQFDASGNVYRVDDAGNAFIMQGLTTHNDMSGRSDSDTHPISAITGLVTALNLKEDFLGNPSANGMHLSSNVAGARTWETVTLPPALFAGTNTISQSFGSPGISELEIEWNSEIAKHAKFVHSNTVQPEELQVAYSGWISVSYNISWQTDEGNRVLTMCWVSVNGVKVQESTSFSYMRQVSYIDVATNTLPPLPIAVTTGDIIRVHAQYVVNDDVGAMPDANNDVYTRPNESFISVQELIQPEG